MARTKDMSRRLTAGGLKGLLVGTAELSLLKVDVAHLPITHVGPGVEAADDGLAARLVVQMGKVDVVRVLS